MAEIILSKSNELKEIISEVIRQELQEFYEKPNRNSMVADIEFLTFKEIQRILKLSKPTIFKLMKKGELKFSKIGYG